MGFIGGVGWHVLHFYEKPERLRGALNDMGGEVLPSVDAVTSVEDLAGRIVLIGLGNSAYDRRTTQHEALWNSHHLRAIKVKVRDVAKEEGGDECIRIKDESGNWIAIPLKFNGDIMTVDIRTPNKKDLLALRVN